MSFTSNIRTIALVGAVACNAAHGRSGDAGIDGGAADASAQGSDADRRSNRRGVPCDTESSWCDTTSPERRTCIYCRDGVVFRPGACPYRAGDPEQCGAPNNENPPTFACDGNEDCAIGNHCVLRILYGQAHSTICQSLDVQLINGDTIEEVATCEDDSECGPLERCQPDAPRPTPRFGALVNLRVCSFGG